jgi:hypothetical protein
VADMWGSSGRTLCRVGSLQACGAQDKSNDPVAAYGAVW